jgi:hypothetical protein
MFATLGAVSAGVVAISVIGDQSNDGGSKSPRITAESRALEQYAAAIAKPTRQAGRSIIAGIRPDITDFRSGRISAEVWKVDMAARASEFSAAWSAIAAVERPRAVATAQSSFDDAFRSYLLAVRVLHEAGDRAGAEREDFIQMGAALGDEGDASFDRGATVIQRARRAAGLSPDQNLPDPKATP